MFQGNVSLSSSWKLKYIQYDFKLIVERKCVSHRGSLLKITNKQSLEKGTRQVIYYADYVLTSKT